MPEKIKDIMAKIESHLFSQSNHSHNQQCDDMTLNHLIIALEWQKRKIGKPPDVIIYSIEGVEEEVVQSLS